MVFEILTVCTGNICRSPLAEHMLRARLAPLDVRSHSVGTRGLNAAPMTDEAIALAVDLGVQKMDAAAHRSRFLTEQHLDSPDLILTMTRDHRRAVAELSPLRLRNTFTLREFARLASAVPIDELRQAAATGRDQGAQVRAVAVAVASFRGLAPMPDDPADDDVIDPFRRSQKTYELSGSQIEPAVDDVVRVLRAVLST